MEISQNSNLISEAKGKKAFAHIEDAYNNLDDSKKAGKDSYKEKKNMFITLIAESMKNPDPNSEMKPEETVMQMMQMHQIESSALMNEKITDMTDQMKNLVKMGQASIQGKDVKIKSNTLLIQNDEAKLEYETPKDLKSLKVIIREQSKNGVAGKEVHRIDIAHPINGKNSELEEGTHALTWDTKDVYGEKMDLSKGKNYTVSFLAKDMEGKHVKIDHKVVGIIEGIDFTRKKDVDVVIGNHHYPIDQLQIFQREQEARSNKDTQQTQTPQELQNEIAQLSSQLSSLNPDPAESNSWNPFL